MSIYARQPLLGLLLLSLMTEPLTHIALAAEKPLPIKLPANSATDSNGNPITIPTQHQSALHYQPPNPPTKNTKAQTQKKKQKQNKSTKHKKQSRKQLLASRNHVADDPSCRWLNKRMQQLERKLKYQQKQEFGFQADELKIRRIEWICMKCGAEGPSQNDHNKCQYKR